MLELLSKKPAAAKGVGLLRSTFKRLLRQVIFHPDAKRDGVYVLVLDGTRPYDPTEIEEAVLYEEAFNRKFWAYPNFDDIARGKARISWRTKRSSREIVEIEPWLLEPGDAKYPGAVYYKGIVVAISGVKNWWDEAWALSFAAMIYAFIMEDMDELKSSDYLDFVPGESFPS